MDAKLKADWVKALRSGNYTQNFNSVGAGTKLCCVGVGGVVVGLTPGIGSSGAGSGECWRELGLDYSQATTLFEMNDKLRKSFPEIADYIEQYL